MSYLCSIAEMPPRQKLLIRSSFARLSAAGNVPALVFYQKLFAADPSLRALFTADIQKQATVFMETLEAMVAALDRPADLAADLRALGERHAGYGVRAAHFAAARQALLDTLAEVAGADFTPEVRDAWAALWEAVAAPMIAAIEGGIPEGSAVSLR